MGKGAEYKVIVKVRLSERDITLWESTDKEKREKIKKKMTQRLENTLSRYYTSETDEYNKLR